MDTVTIFLFVAGVIFAGFFGLLFFKRTSFSDLVLLMLLGLVMGPVLNIFGTETTVFLRGLSPFFSTLALVLILFDGGLDLRLSTVLKSLYHSVLFSVAAFLVSILVIFTILFLAGWNFWVALLVGIILGGTSSAVVIWLVNKATVSAETKTIVTIESTINDVLCAVFALALIEVLLSQGIVPSEIAQSVLGSFSIAVLLGIVAGFIWLKVLRKVPAIQPYEYILTLGVLFLLFAVTEFSKGNGTFSALVFGLVLGNARKPLQGITIELFGPQDTIRSFQTEISFFVRTFFFVYLGLIFSIEQLNQTLLELAVLIVVALFFARWATAKILFGKSKTLQRDVLILGSMMAKGMVAAVLATYPVSFGLTGRFPEMNQIVELAFLVVLFSNLAATIGLFWFERNHKKERSEPAITESVSIEEVNFTNPRQ